MEDEQHLQALHRYPYGGSPLVEDLLKSFSIVHSTEDLLSIRIAEAILIKNLKPQINVKYNELFDFLKLF